MTLMLTLSLLALTALGRPAQAKEYPPLEVAPAVDFQRYAGTWYEVARLPNRFQEQCASDVTATYTLLADGDIEVVNRCRKADGSVDEAVGRAKLAGKDGPNTKLKVRFAPAWLSLLPSVWGDYWIIDLAPDYSYAVIGEPARKYFWVLSRTTTLDDATLEGALERATRQGYDLGMLLRTQHGNDGKAQAPGGQD